MTKTFDCIVILPRRKTGQSAKDIRSKIEGMMFRYDGHNVTVRPYQEPCFCVKHGNTVTCRVCKGTGVVWTRRNPWTKWQSYGSGQRLSESLAAIYQTPSRMNKGDVFYAEDIYSNHDRIDPALLAAMNLKPEAIVTPDGLWHDDVDAILADWSNYKGHICVVLTCTV